MTAVAGLRGTGDFSTDERPKNFREMILFMNPNGSAPIFALTAKAKKKTVDDPEYAWWNETNVLIRLQINNASNYTSSATQLTVDTLDPTASTLNVNYGTATNLKPGDLLMVEPASDAAVFAPEYVEVTDILSDTDFVVRRGAAGSTAAAINDNQFLLLVGSSYAEGGVAPKAVARNPVKFNNYTQIFKNSYELSNTASQTRFRTGDPWSNDKKRKMFDHSRDIEMATLFGRKNEIASSAENGKPLRTFGGLRQQIPSTRQFVFSGPVKLGTDASNSFLDNVYKVFDYDSPAGDTRLAFCGNYALNSLAKVAASTTNVRLNSDQIITQYGMQFREFIMPQGRLLIKSHPLLNIHGGIYAKSMFILDFASINYVCLKGRDTKTFDDVQNKDEDVRRGFIMTECSLALDRGGLTCAYLGNVTDV
jgi:hypothetical protein